MKKTVPFFQYEFLKKELQYLEQQGLLLPNQAENAINHYEVQTMPKQRKSSLNFIQAISIIGAFLIGLGILSFVASNWSGLTDMTKFFVLLFTLVFMYLGAWFTEESKPKFSRSLYYIGGFAFGAEIFYIGQLFHLGGEIENALIAWAIGLLPLAYYLKDKYIGWFSFSLIYLFIQMRFMFTEGEPSYWMVIILPILFAFGHYVKRRSPILLLANLVLLYQFIEMKFTYVVLYEDKFPIVFTLALPLLFFIGHKWMNKSIPLFIVNVFLSIQWFVMALIYLDVDKVMYYLLPLFALGMVMYKKQLKDYKDVMKWIGFGLQFVSGIMLTFSISWTNGTYNDTPMSVPFWTLFGIAYFMYGLYLVYRNELMGVVIVGVLVFRFYVDLSLAFMNKSIAFLIGGMLLLAIGYWFEKTRRGENKGHETNAK